LAVTIDLRKLRQPISECFGGLLVAAHAVSCVIIAARSLFSLPFALRNLHFAIFNLRPFVYHSKHLRRLQAPPSVAFSLGIPGRLMIRPQDSATSKSASEGSLVAWGAPSLARQVCKNPSIER
jgi:hypothetical protein